MVLKKERPRTMRFHGTGATPPGAEYLKTDKELREYRKRVFAKKEKQMDEYYDGFDNCVTAVGLCSKSFDLPKDVVTVIA